MATRPPVAAEAAVLGPTSKLTRRVEIYESDGVTPWAGGSFNDRLIDGSVGIDYTRDERRSIDLTLDNTDFALRHDPNGFWYDKVMKVYYGVEYIDTTPTTSYKTHKNIFPNPSMKNQNGTTEVRRNFASDPAATVSQGTQTNKLTWGPNWYGSGGATGTTSVLTNIAGPVPEIKTAIRKTWTTDGPTGDTGFNHSAKSGTTGWVGTVGASYTASSYLRAYTTASTPRIGSIRVFFFDSANTLISAIGSPATNLNPDTWTRVSLTFTVPANCTGIAIWSDVSGTTAFKAGDTCDGTGLLVENVKTLLPYFDGNTVGRDNLTFSWTGTANSSPCIATGPNAHGAAGSFDNSNSTKTGALWQADAVNGGVYLDVWNNLSGWGLLNIWSTLTVGQAGRIAYSFDVTSSIDVNVGYFVEFGGVAARVSGSTALKAGVKQRISAVAADPKAYSSGSIYLNIGSHPPGNTGITGRFLIEDIIISADVDSAPLMFSGDTQPFGNRTYAWEGTPGRSTSIETITVTTPTSTRKTWEAQIGEFMIDSISEDHFPYTTKVVGRDYTKKCMLSKFVNATAFTANSKIEDVVKAIGQNAGVYKFIMPLTGQTLGQDYFFERNTSRWDAMKQIATAFGFELFFDAQGYLVMRAYQDPVSAPLAYTLETGQFGTLVSYSKSVNDTRIFNHIIVTGESTDQTTIPVMAESLNTEAGSPTSIAQLGDRVYQYSSAFITTTQQAQSLADTYLSIMGLEEFDLNFSAISLFWLEVGEIVEFLDPREFAAQPTRFLLSSLNLPLGLGAMTGNAKRVSIVS